MKPACFDYHAPETVEEVLSCLARYDGDARLLAGGQSLVPMMNFRVINPAAIIDLAHCKELRELRFDGEKFRCAAMVRQVQVAADERIKAHVPLLAAAFPLMSSVSIRNRGTVCGSLAHADRLAELPSVAVALDATMEIVSMDGIRKVAASDFFIGDMTTAVEPEEMLLSVSWPVSPARARGVFLEVGNRHHGFALVGVAGEAVVAGDGEIESLRLATKGAGPVPGRLHAIEALVTGRRLHDVDLNEVVLLAQATVDPDPDPQASVEYRRRAVGVLTKRVIEKLVS